MAWTIKVSPVAQQELRKLDAQQARRVLKFLNDRLAKLDNPRNIGKALQGSRFGEFWKDRVGDFRIIYKIEDDQLVVLVVRVGHRKEIYR